MKDDYNYNESIKTLRTNIQFCGSNIHTIMFTSAMPDEGKSDVAFAAASSGTDRQARSLLLMRISEKSVLVSRHQLTEECKRPFSVLKWTEGHDGDPLRYQF